VDFIPTKLSGKADQHALLSLLVESKATHRSGGITSSPRQHMVPNSPIEEAVLAIYRRELKHEGIGIDSGFFEKGGDSLKAVRIVAYLHTLHEEHPELQMSMDFSTLSVTDILQQHTPGALLQSCVGYSPAVQPLTPGIPIMPRPTEMRLQAPASFQQTTMYTGEHLVASQGYYNMMIRFGAVGKLNVEALKMALAFLWRRHQVLRTALVLQVPYFLTC
ncbi:MAG: hypothetical protein GY746_04295, partial [Gammaproteobacteria bacterium]|nr:hypothetical protein [Gammaproteobacteria bacterium]